MVSRCRLNLIIYIISFMFCHCAAIPEPFCSEAIFGVPSGGDCLAAFSKIPFAGNFRTSHDANSFQLFGEPQYLSPPFGAVVNRYAPRPINQLPKMWQFNGCRIAFMSYGNGNARGVRPLFGASWKQILEQIDSITQCIHPVQEGITAAGGWSIFSAQRTGLPAGVLYMYSVDSPFVNVVNRYMSTGWAIKPPDSESQLISLLANYSSIANQSVTPSVSTPNIAMNVTFLDRTD